MKIFWNLVSNYWLHDILEIYFVKYELYMQNRIFLLVLFTLCESLNHILISTVLIF